MPRELECDVPAHASERPPCYEDCCEDPAHDLLPPYSCSLQVDGHFLRMKPELTRSEARAEHRRWSKVIVELRGTLLLIRVLPTRIEDVRHNLHHGMFPRKPPKPMRCLTYSLQRGAAGLASDYQKRYNVLRVRTEAGQFLLQADTMLACFRWVDGLSAAVAISSPLEAWTMPKYHTIPRPGRWRRPPGSVGGEQIRVTLTRTASSCTAEVGYKSSFVEDSSPETEDCKPICSLQLSTTANDIDYMMACTRELSYSGK